MSDPFLPPPPPDSAPTGGSASETPSFGPPNVIVDPLSTGAPRPGRKKVLAGGAVAAVIVAVVAMVVILPGGDTAGAASPEDAVTSLIETVGQADLLDLPSHIAPSETNGYKDFAESFANKLPELKPFTESLSEFVDSDDDSEDGEGDDGEGLEWMEELGVDLDFDTDELPQPSISDLTVIEQHDTVALVEFSLAFDFDGISKIGGATADDLALMNSEARAALDEAENERFELVTVKEDGAWYISVILSAAHIGTGFEADITEDFAAIDNLPDATAQSPDEAISGMIGSVFDNKLEDLPKYYDLPIARLLVAYPDALESMQVDLEPEESINVTINTLEISKTGDDEYTLERLELTNHEIGETFELDGSCVTIRPDGETKCLTDELPWDADIDGLPINIHKERGGYVISPTHSMFTMARTLIDNLDIPALARLADVAVYDSAISVDAGATNEISFDGKPYIVAELDTDEVRQPIEVTFDGEELEWESYADFGGLWLPVYEDEEPAVSENIRVIIYAPQVDPTCTDTCPWDTQGSTTFTIN